MHPQLEKLDPSERKQFMEDNADKVEDSNYFKKFGPEDLESARINFVENSHAIYMLEEEYQEVKKGYSERLKDSKSSNKEVLKSIRDNGRFIDGKLYHFKDDAAGVMEIYTEDGEFFKSRRLTPEEKQMAIPLRIAK